MEFHVEACGIVISFGPLRQVLRLRFLTFRFAFLHSGALPRYGAFSLS